MPRPNRNRKPVTLNLPAADIERLRQQAREEAVFPSDIVARALALLWETDQTKVRLA